MSKREEAIKLFMELNNDPNLSEEMKESLKTPIRISMNPECSKCSRNILNNSKCTGQHGPTPCILFKSIMQK